MPSSSNYYDALLEQLMLPGDGWSDRQYNRGMRQQASGMEDERLRGLLGSKRKRRRGDQTPEGAYTSVRNPFTWLAAQQAIGGAPARRFGAVDIWSSPQERQAEMGRNRNWGQHQLSIWGR